MKSAGVRPGIVRRRGDRVRGGVLLAACGSLGGWGRCRRQADRLRRRDHRLGRPAAGPGRRGVQEGASRDRGDDQPDRRHRRRQVAAAAVRAVQPGRQGLAGRDLLPVERRHRVGVRRADQLRRRPDRPGARRDQGLRRSRDRAVQRSTARSAACATTPRRTCSGTTRRSSTQNGYTVPKTWEEYGDLAVKIAKEHPGKISGFTGDAYAPDRYLWASGCPTNAPRVRDRGRTST